jgi:4'-phosphopantetheinyl transferase EntD
MPTVYWSSQRLGDVPAGSAWLSEAERALEAGFRVPKRRSDWRLGRWAAKRALTCLQASNPAEGCRLEDLARAEVRPTAAGVPEAFWDGARLPWALSISHSGGRALVAVGPTEHALGCDIEGVELRSAAFLEDCFTSAELDTIAASAAPELLSTLCWSAKESALKALGVGLRLPLQGLAVDVTGAAAAPRGWRPIQVVEREGGRRLAGHWRCDAGSVLTIVAAPPCREPSVLPSTP